MDKRDTQHSRDRHDDPSGHRDDAFEHPGLLQTESLGAALAALIGRLEKGVAELVERFRSAEEQRHQHGIWIPNLIEHPPSREEMDEALRSSMSSNEHDRMAIGISRVLALRADEIRSILLPGGASAAPLPSGASTHRSPEHDKALGMAP